MALFRKFYMADPADGAGPTKVDLKNAQELKEVFAEIKDTITDVGTEIDRSLTQKLSNFRGTAKTTAENTLKSLTAELNRAAKGVDKTRLATEDLGKKFVSSKKIQENITAIKARQSNIESTLLLLERQGVELSAQDEENITAATNALRQQIGIEDQLLERAKAREKAAGNVGKLFQGLAKIPILGSLVDAQSVSEKINQKAEETGSRWKALGAGMVEVFKSIGRSLTDPSTILLGIFTVLSKIVELVIAFNQKTFDLAKNLGVTVNEAATLQQSFVEIANTSKNLGITSSQLAKTYVEITNSLGFMIPANKEFLETATLIQKRLGASAEDMNALALQSSLSGKTLEETLGTLNASRNIEGARNKLMLTQKQLLDGIAKTSTAVLINFKGNVGALGEAIVRATKLGTTLDTVNKQGESLLDFESSISKEFEAQLLTGRDINLTRAREFALAGDTKNLMEELNRQGATYQQFMSENVIARKAEAAAVGLSVEEYSKILLQQKQANDLGAQQGQTAKDRYDQLVKTGMTQAEIARKLGSEQEAEDLRRASMQDKFQAAVEKLKDTIGAMLQGPIGGVIDKFANFISKASNVTKIVEKLKSVFETIGNILMKLPEYLNAAVTVSKLLVSLSIARAVATISSVPLVGLAAGVAAYAGLSAMVDNLGVNLNAPQGGSEMTTPLNPATANATTQNTQTTAPNQQAPVFTFHHVTQLDGQVLAKYTTKEIMKTPGLGDSKR